MTIPLGFGSGGVCVGCEEYICEWITVERRSENVSQSLFLFNALLGAGTLEGKLSAFFQFSVCKSNVFYINHPVFTTSRTLFSAADNGQNFFNTAVQILADLLLPKPKNGPSFMSQCLIDFFVTGHIALYFGNPVISV